MSGQAVMAADRVRDELQGIVGVEHVLEDPAALASYARDKSPFPELRPGLVVRPGDVEEVAEVVRLANRTGVKIVPRGNGFSIAGFPPVGDAQALFLDMRRLDRILDVDEASKTITAQAGAKMFAVHSAAAERGLYVQTVYVPIHYTTLGGVLSGVLGGGLPSNAVIGTVVSDLVALQVVLPTGDVVRTNAGGSNVHRTTSTMPDGDGPFLTPMFVGDGGSLGVKTEATLRAMPAATCQHAGAWELPDFASAWRAVRELSAIREIPASSIGVTESPTPDAVRQLSYVSVASDERLLALQVARADEVIERCGGRPGSAADTAMAETMTEPGGSWADQFLNVDRALVAFIVANRDFEDAHWRFRRFLAERFEERRLEELGLSLLVVYAPVSRHAVYVTTSLIYDPAIDGGREATAELAREAYQVVAELGGYSEAHQGVGAQISAASWSPEYRRMVGAIKAALDPNDVLNPGLWS